MEKSIEYIAETLYKMHQIECYSCGKDARVYGYEDDFQVAELFSEAGWAGNPMGCLCANCISEGIV